MKESTKRDFGVTCVISFVIGLSLFLSETRSTGGAIERFNLIVQWSTIQIVGIILEVAALIALMVLYFPELKKNLKHHTG